LPTSQAPGERLLFELVISSFFSNPRREVVLFLLFRATIFVCAEVATHAARSSDGEAEAGPRITPAERRAIRKARLLEKEAAKAALAAK
jgi:hypothetical protein